MSGETYITVVGNMVGPFELRFTPSGAAVANGTVASTPRTFDRQSQEWVDGETAFWDVTVWREQAENTAESLPEKGARVIVYGRIKTDTWEDKQTGQKRSKQIIEADDIGPSLRYATAQVRRTPKGDGNNGAGFGGQGARGPANGAQGHQGPQGGFRGSGGPQGRPPQGRPPQGQQRRGPAPYGEETDPWQGNQQGGNYDWGNEEDAPPF